jgi:3-dehydroquinate synthase
LVRVSVPIPGRTYEVVIGSDVIERAAELLPDLPGASAAFIVSDRAVADHWFEPLAESFRVLGLSVVPLTVPAGEDAKTLQVYGTLLHQLATQEAHRDDVVVALGGGATGDVAGFVASTYMRGIPFVQVPTTLTAQVDAAVGGKTGLNLPEGKNLVGTFAQPVGVLADVGVLRTLSDRDYRSGLAEVVKYGLAIDSELLDSLESDPGPVLDRDPVVLEHLVARCIGCKARTVAGDERDTAGRLVLNYGHTLGHALERLDAFSGRSHGEAIAVGMVFAARLAEARNLSEPGLAVRTKRLLSSFGLEVGGALPPARDIVAAFRLDKKFKASKSKTGVRFILLEGVGRPVVVEDVPEAQVRQILYEMGAAA